MDTELDKYKKKLEELLSDPSKQGYFALRKIADQQIDILNGFKLRDNIDLNPKDSKYYERVKDIWEGLPKVLLDLKNLKSELKITDEEEKKEQKQLPPVEQLLTK